VASLAALGQQRNVTREGDTWVETSSGTLSAANALKLTTDMGSVHIQGGNQSQITYEVKKRVHAYSEQSARRMFDSLDVTASSNGSTAYIRSEANEDSYHNFNADFNVTVPRSIALVSAHTGGGSLVIIGINGRAEGETGGGNVHLDDINGAIDVTTGGGNVDLGHAGSTVQIETGGGSIHIGNVGGALQARSGGGHIEVESGKGAMEINTGGGSVHVGSCGGSLQVQTGGDNITVGDVAGGADLETGGGSIRLNSAKGQVRAESGGGSVELHGLARGAEAETGAGPIVAEFVGGKQNFTDSKLETAAGDVRVYLPSDLGVTVYADVDVANGSNAIHSDFSDLKIISEGSDYGPKEAYCKGKINGGGPSLRVHTSTGNIEFLRASTTAQNH